MECLEFACKELGTTKNEIRARTRNNKIVAKRWMIVCFMYELGMNYNQIGRKIMRDHQTIMHAVECADRNIWYVAEELLCKYEALISPKKKVPNYKNSTIEVVNVR